MMHASRGAALIMALLIMALASSMAVFMAWQQSLWTQQAANLIAGAQADALTQAAIDWARGVLAEDLRKNNVDYLGENWARPLVNLPVENASLSGAIEDQQGKFNLNNLYAHGRDSGSDILYFRQLLEQLRLPGELSNALLDWLDADNEARVPGGAEDSLYLALNPPYRCANQPLAHIDELYRVRGFNREIIARLKPYVSVLPEHTPLNVNTASRENLKALLTDYSDADIDSIISSRASQHFSSKQDFRARLPHPPQTLRDELYDVASQYFLVHVQIRTAQTQSGALALLARTSPNRWPNIVWRQQIVQ